MWDIPGHSSRWACTPYPLPIGSAPPTFFFFLLFVVDIYLRSFSSYTSSSNLLFLPSISDELALCIAVIGINFECLEPEIRFFTFLAYLLKHFFSLLILQLKRTKTLHNISDLSSHLYLDSYLRVCHFLCNHVSIFFSFPEIFPIPPHSLLPVQAIPKPLSLSLSQHSLFAIY